MTIYQKFNLSRRRLFKFLLIIVLIYWMLQLHFPTIIRQEFISDDLDSSIIVDLKRLINNLSLQYSKTKNIESEYVLYREKCKIRNLNPFHPDMALYYSPKKYISCRKKDLLTYVKNENDSSFLNVDARFIRQYTNNHVHCCSRAIFRTKRFLGSRTTDTALSLSPCTNFNKRTIIQGPVLVTCIDDYAKELYSNVHTTVRKTEEIKEKMKHFRKPKEHLSVLIVGIDSISRMNLIRSLPYTYLFLRNNKWLEFKGFNKIGDDAFSNMMGMLAGYNETMSYKVCNPSRTGPLDRCKLLWYDYRRLGFITAYAEDEAEISTFSRLGGGFNLEPTDYYFKPYILASERYLTSRVIKTEKYCTGPETATERILNLARDFTLTFKDYPNFGLFWINSCNHNINSVSRMDDRIYEFLKYLTDVDIVKNTFVLFLSDHGFRFAPVTYNNVGQMEERMPLFYMSVPRWFKYRYPEKYQNLVKNSKRLATPYDIYMTLQEILILSGKKYNVKKSAACTKCKSLFEEINKDRSCEDAGIERHKCGCFNSWPIPTTHIISVKAAQFIINKIRKIINLAPQGNRCAYFKLKEIKSASIWEKSYSEQKDVSYILLTIKTKPVAVFQATLSVNMSKMNPIFGLEGTINRYDKFSWCSDDALLKRYCHCKYSVGDTFRRLIDKVATILSIEL